jgi:type II secretory pathway pseudopilin PulG
MTTRYRSEAGFSLAEVLVATTLLLAVSSIVTSALLQMTNHQQTIWNRTEMHSGVRGATELLQQEVGQAGRITLPAPVTLGAAIVTVVGTLCNPGVAVTATVNSTTGMFPKEWLTTLDGDASETVAIVTVPSATTFTACFTQSHLTTTTKIMPLGGFATGIVPPNPPSAIVSGSSANKLKLYGDVNGDGNMVYIEYYCDNGDATTAGSFNLYRNMMPFQTTAAQKTANFGITNSQILLSNVHQNPNDASGNPRPCFEYQTATVVVSGMSYTFVLDVAVTLTVQGQSKDHNVTQTETKALLNVSPRNVFFAWEFAGLNYPNRIQPTPQTVLDLLP